MASGMIKWDPFTELGELRSRIDRVFGDLTDSSPRGWRPAVDIQRDNGNLVLRADIPGITPEEVKIEVEDDILTVSGEHEESKEDTDKHYVRRERHYGAFSRSMVLPPGVDPEKIKAHTKDGVVEVTIPLPSDKQQEKVTIAATAA